MGREAPQDLSGNLHLGGDAAAAVAAEDREVVGGLHRQPEFRLVAEVEAQAEGGLRRQAALAGDDFLDALRGDAEAEGEGEGGGGLDAGFQLFLQ